jgi:hypothetical protein
MFMLMTLSRVYGLLDNMEKRTSPQPSPKERELVKLTF